MPRFTFENFGKALSILLNMVSAGFIIINLKSMTICNPIISVFFYSILFTILFFLAPFLYSKMESKKEKIMMVIVIVLVAVLLIGYWLKISDNSNCIIHKDSTTKSEPKVILMVKHDTIFKPSERSVLSFVHATNGIKAGQPIRSRAKNHVTIDKSPSLAEHDTLKAAVKYNFNAPVSNSAVGDGATQTTINNGVQPRIISNNYLTKFCVQFPNHSIQIYFRDSGSADAEMNNLKRQIIEMLRAKGYNNINDYWEERIGFPEEDADVTTHAFSDGSGVIFHIRPAKLQ